MEGGAVQLQSEPAQQADAEAARSASNTEQAEASKSNTVHLIARYAPSIVAGSHVLWLYFCSAFWFRSSGFSPSTDRLMHGHAAACVLRHHTQRG